jgi:hypothetical protein
MSYKINILDTGDNYILAQKNGIWYDEAIKLYEILDISITEIDTGRSVPPDIADFVYQSIGRVISNNVYEGTYAVIDLLEKLKKDIDNVVEFAKVKWFWENLQFPPKPKKVDETIYDNIAYKNQQPLTVEQLLPKDKFADVIGLYPRQDLTTNDVQVYVIFNNIYNLGIVVDNATIKHINKVTQNFPEFQLVMEYSSQSEDDNIRKHVVQLFHKVSFDSFDDIKKKIDAFKSLYDVPVNTEGNKNHVPVEKMRVKQFFLWSFVTSKEVDKRMKANDLYKEIINHMCISYEDAAAFKKRLAGYLLEFGLQKKRFSDAYYYYGIERREPTKLSLEEIEEQRAKERKDWFYQQPSVTDKIPVVMGHSVGDLSFAMIDAVEKKVI